jgi:hypothetical protein
VFKIIKIQTKEEDGQVKPFLGDQVKEWEAITFLSNNLNPNLQQHSPKEEVDS